MPDARSVDEWIKAGQLSQADEAARQLLIAEPENPEPIFLMARVLAAQNRFAEAIRLLRTIPKSEPGAKLIALGQAADWYVELGEWAKAEQCYRLLLQQSPDADIARRRFARLLNRQGHRYEAARYLNELCRRGNVEEEELRSLITLSYAFSDENETDVYGPIGPVGHARLALSSGKYSEAESLLATEMHRTPQAYALYGRVLISQQKIEDVAKWQEVTVPLAEEQADYWFTKGSFAILQGDYGKAAIYLGETVLRDPTDKVTYLRFAKALGQLGMHAEALQAERTAELLRRSAVIGIDLADGVRSAESISELAAILEELDRPFEALGWQAVAVGYQLESLSPAEINERIAALNRRRLELIELESPSPASTVLCGVRLDKLRERYGDIKQPAAPIVPGTVSVPNASLSISAKLVNVASHVGVSHQYNATNASDPSQVGVSQELGGGVGVIDYDLNGFPDVYLVQAAATPEERDGQKPNCLYRNEGQNFIDTTLSAGADDRGFGLGVSSGDVNQDGFPDLLIANLGANRLLINNGDGTFSSRQLEAGQPTLWTSSFAIADLTGDSMPDLVEVNYLEDKTAYLTDYAPYKYKSAIDRVYVNDRKGGFLPAIPLGSEAVPGLGVIVTDFDNDRSNEIFIANDGRANHYWMRKDVDESGAELSSVALLPSPIVAEPSKAMMESASVKGLAVNYQGIGGAGMGVASGDFDRDGSIDIYVTNYYEQPNFLMLQTQPGTFVDGTWRLGMYDDSFYMLGFGTQAMDVDNDGSLEIAVVNGHVHDLRSRNIPYHMPPQLYGVEGDGKFHVRDVDDASGYWQTPALGRGLVTLDWNRDGRTDLIATHLDSLTALLENRTEGSNAWLQVQLVGRQSEREAIGARITVFASGSSFVKTVTSGDGYCGKNEGVVGIGLGDAKSAVIQVDWPSGESSRFELPELNARLLLIEGDSDYWID